jgi:hypothetical protein
MRSLLVSLALVLTTSSAFAQAPAFQRGWIDVNIGGASPAESALTTSGSYPYFGEVATESASYEFNRGGEFDFGGGVMITPQFGLGVSFAGTATNHPVNLSANIPHPIYRSAYGSDSGETTESLDRTEGSVNIQAVFQMEDKANRNRFRFFGGPTHFRVKADAVGEVEWEQVYGIFSRVNDVTITGWNGEEVEETGWGVNVGADYAYFFNRIVGLGMIGRYNYGKVTFTAVSTASDSIIPDEDVEVKVGGFQFGGGLRLRF